MKRFLLPAVGIGMAAAVAAGAYIIFAGDKNSMTEEEPASLPSQSHSNSANEQPDRTPSLENIQAVVSGGYTRPQWSPDGSMLLFTKQGNVGLFYIDANNSSEIVQLNEVKGAGYGAAWSVDGLNIFYTEKKDFVPLVKSVSLETKKISAHPEIHFSGIRSYAITSGKGPFFQLNQQTLQVEASEVTGKKWMVTDGVGQFYDHLLSPDKTKVAVHRDADILIYHADGSGLYQNLGRGIASSWSPDGKYLIAFIDESNDGHQITNAELYLLASDASGRWRLTTTVDVTEMWPSLNPVKNQIAFADHRSGQIFIADIIYPSTR